MYFDSRAKDFDTILRKDRAGIIADHIRQYCDAAHRTAMEFGCGTGLIGLHLTDLFSSLTLIDTSQGMIDQAQTKLAAMPHVEAVRMDLCTGQLPARRFDCIFTSMVLHHIPDIANILAILYGLLNDGGQLVVVDLTETDRKFHLGDPNFDGHDGFAPPQMHDWLQCVGFYSIDMQTFYHGVKEIGEITVPYSLFIARAKKRETGPK